MVSANGTVYLRPVRLGFVASNPTREVVLEAVRLASEVWGGIYFPIFDADDPNLVRRAEAFAIDVLHPLDESAATTAVTELVGFRWRGAAEWGPFGSSEDGTVREGLLPINRIVESASPSWSLSWAHDALGALYGVWFGGSAPVAEPLLEVSPSLSTVASQVDLFARSPIAMTREAIEYRGDGGLAVVIVDCDRVADLLRFWNLRAAGCTVLPWVVGYAEENELALTSWLTDSDVVSRVPRARSGDSSDVGPLVHISAGDHDDEAEVIRHAVEQLGLRSVPGTALRGWWGHHPLQTSVERRFEIQSPADDLNVDIALPTLPLIGEESAFPGTICADVVVFRESESAIGRSLSLPAVRNVAASIERRTLDVERFHRPTGEGRAIGVRASASAITIALVPNLEVFERLLPQEASVGQSDDGRFASQFVDRLGGPSSPAASQPALRRVLYDLGNSDRSAPIARLIRIAQDTRGAWPDAMSRQTPADYAKSVVYALADSGIIVPTVSVRCPRCTTESDVSPDNLATEMRCALCRSELNLGLALALQGPQNPWRYRLAAHLPPGRIGSGLSMMAANAVLRSVHRAGSAPSMPHVFGLTVSLPSWSCEVDIAALIIDGPLTLAVVGELKGRDQVDANDIANLQRVQGMLRAAGVEAFILAGTTRDRFEDPEVALLRAACEAAPQRLSPHDHGLVLPIVLCGHDMSLPWFDDDHPWRWGTPGSAPLGGFSELSCRRNLGLEQVEPDWTSTEGRWNLQWTSPPESD